MNKLWTVLLVLAVASAAFLLGRQFQPAPAAAPTPAPAAVAAATPAAVAATEDANSKLPSAQPPQTFRGPDGLPHLIAYQVGVVPDNSNREAVKAGVLADMNNHPGNIERAYDLSAEDIAAIVAGTKPFPETLLPKPGAAPTK